MMGSPAYWISPQGAVVQSAVNHIDTVLSNPSKFGYEEDYLRNLYDYYGEKYGTEGKAREAVLNELIRNGWIRVRRYPNRFWSVNVYKLSGRARDNIWDLFLKLTEKGVHGFKEDDMYLPVSISEFRGGTSVASKQMTVKDVIGNALYMEEIEPIKYKVFEVGVEDLPDLYIGNRSNEGNPNSMRPMDFWGRKIGESTLSGGLAYPGSPRRTTYRVGDLIRFKLRDKRLEGTVEVPFTSDGKMVVVLGDIDDPDAKRVSTDPDAVELINRVIKKDVVKK